MHSVSLLADIAWCIMFGAAAAHLARLLRQPMILGYVLAGVALGAPLGLGLVHDTGSIRLIAEIGLIFLLFIIGLEIDVREILRLGRSTFVVGLAQVLGCTLLGLLLFAPLGLEGGRFGLFYLAFGAALSSTLVVVKLLHDKAEIHTVTGRLTVGVLVIQDLVVILFMAFQPNLTDPGLGAALRSLGFGAALVAAAFAASRYGLGLLFRTAAKVPELVLLSAVGWCFLVSAVAAGVGLSREMGALIAGLSIAAFPYGPDVVARVAGIRDFFVTLFFVSLGLLMPVPDVPLAGAALYVCAVVLVTTVATVVPAAVFSGRGLRIGTVAALNLSQISEFSLVIVAVGVSLGHVNETLQALVLTAMLLAAVLSTYAITYSARLAPALLRVAAALGIREPAADELGAVHGGGTRDIVVLGCFREGLALLERIDGEQPDLRRRIAVFDFNPDLGPALEARGYDWRYADLAHPETLAHLGIGEAALVIATIPDSFLKGTTNLRLLEHVSQLAPRARLVMTAETQRQAEELVTAGAHETVVVSRAAGDRLFEALARWPGVARRLPSPPAAVD